MLQPGLLLAADSTGAGMSVALNAGESYVINNVSPGDVPGVKVITNPHALIVHNEEPGKVVLLGAEAGEWNIQIKTANGDQVNYDVTVRSVGSAFNINHPGTSPGPISGSGRSSGSAAAPAVASLDAGAGPVSPSSSSSSSSSSSTGTATTVAGSETVAAASPAAAAPVTTAPVAPMAPAPMAPAPMVTAPEAGTALATVNTSTFNYAPSVPAASYAPPHYNQTPEALSSERYRSDPSISLNGGVLDSGAISGGPHYLPDDGVQLQTGGSRIIDFKNRLRRVSIADTTVADIQVINPFQVNLIGHKPGFTTLAVWNQQGQYVERPVRIDPNGKQQVLLQTMVAELDRSAIENQGTTLSLALTHAGLSQVLVPGAPATPFSASTSFTAANGTTGSSPNSLPPGGTLIGMLLSPSLTYGLAAGNKDYQFQGLFQFLETHNLAKLLAQPQLLANSGEEAKFLSGGEIPIVIAQALNTSIVFKQFGTMVEFVPTVIGRDDIELLVKPEVSQPDYAAGVSMFGFTIPAFVTRRAETMVQLKDNQTLIIAGLILHQKTTQVQKVPYLGDLPYLGGLFRNTSYNNTETDLVISVTPQIVRPLPDGASVYNPNSVPELTHEQIETRRLAQPDASRPRF